MAVSLWLLFDQHLYMQNVGADQTNYYVGTYIILAVGGIMTLVGEEHDACMCVCVSVCVVVGLGRDRSNERSTWREETDPGEKDP